MLHAEVVEVLVFEAVVGFVGEWAAADGDVIEQSAGATVWSVYGTQESPTFRQQLTHSSSFHFCEVGSSVDGSEMGKEAHVVELVGNNAKAFVLHQVQSCPGLEVACRKEVLKRLADHVGL